MEKQRPLDTLRDGALKATIWENPGEDGEIYHTVSLGRTYENQDGKLKDSNSFSASDLLRVAELAREAHGVVRDVRREISHDRRAAQKQQQYVEQDTGGPEPATQTKAAPSREERPRRFRNRAQPGMER